MLVLQEACDFSRRVHRKMLQWPCIMCWMLEKPCDLRHALVPVKKDDLDAVKRPLLAAEYTAKRKAVYKVSDSSRPLSHSARAHADTHTCTRVHERSAIDKRCQIEFT